MPGIQRAKGDPITSPYVYDSGPDANGKSLTCAFSFNNNNRSLSGAVVHRDPGCLYVAVLVGDPNGTPVRVPASGSIPEGDTSISKGQLSANGFSTVEDVLALQITATA